MKKIIALMLCLTTVLCASALLSSCGKTDSLVGKWEAGVSFEKLLEISGLDGADETTKELLGNCDLSGLKFPLIMEFTDKTVTLTTDKDKVVTTIGGFADIIVDAMLKYLSDSFAAEGTAMTEEEILAFMEMSKDELKESITKDIDVESLMKDISEEDESEYTFKDGKLTVTDDDGTDTMTVELSGNKFTITDSLDPQFKALIPMEFVKIG